MFSNEQGGHSSGEPGKHGKVRETGKVGESVFLHMVNYCEYWSSNKMCKKRNYLLGKVVHHVMYKQRLSHWSILKNIVVIKTSWTNMHFVFIATVARVNALQVISWNVGKGQGIWSWLESGDSEWGSKWYFAKFWNTKISICCIHSSEYHFYP